jgi:flagellar biosynthesis anti-sigma factor FlgM
MRIDLYGSGPVATPALPALESHSGQAPTAPAVQQQETDRTTLSSDSLSVSSLTQQALAAGTSRTAQVDALRQSVSSGDYKLEPSSIAQAILKDRA